MNKSFLIAFVLTATSGIAAADQAGFYTYGSIGQTTAGLDKGTIDRNYEQAHGLTSVKSAVNGRPAIIQMQLGYQFNAGSAIELGYGITQKASYALSVPTNSHEYEHAKLATVVYAATLPLVDGFSLTGRAGLAYVQSSGHGSITDFGGHATRLTGGLGVKYDVTEKWSVRTDWNGYTMPSAAKLSSGSGAFTVGVGYKF